MRLRNLRWENYSDYSHGPKDNQMCYEKVDYNSIKIKQNKCYDKVRQREMSYQRRGESNVTVQAEFGVM